MDIPSRCDIGALLVSDQCEADPPPFRRGCRRLPDSGAPNQGTHALSSTRASVVLNNKSPLHYAPARNRVSMCGRSRVRCGPWAGQGGAKERTATSARRGPNDYSRRPRQRSTERTGEAVGVVARWLGRLRQRPGTPYIHARTIRVAETD
jgi:hypothetical protein